MLKLHCSDLWVHIEKLSQSSKRRQAAVAYVSSDSIIMFGKGDTLVVDASVDQIKGGLTSAKVLDRAFKRGTEIFSCPNLHAKVYDFDGMAVIGSSNTSVSSTARMLEAAVITDEPSLTSAARHLIAELQGKSKPLSATDIRKLLKLPIERRFSFGTRRPAPSINPSSGTTWLIATHDLDMSRYTDEEKLAERGQNVATERLSKLTSGTSWIRFGKKLGISKRGRVGDWVIQMQRTTLDGRVTQVSRSAPIRYIQEEPTCVRVYLEAFKNSEDENLPWGAFQRIAKNAEIPKERLGKRCMGVLTDTQADALESLWKMQLKLVKK